MYVHNEMTMDQFHKHIDEIYMMKIKPAPQAQWRGINPEPYFNFNYKEHPELKSYTNIQKYEEGDMKITFEEVEYSPEGIVVDSTFFEIFDFTLKIGDPRTVLTDPSSILITERWARKVFGDQNPMGKQLHVTSNFKKNHTIAGIVKTPPPNSSISFDFVLPSDWEPNKYDKGDGAFFLVNEEFEESSFIKKIEGIGRSHRQFGESIMGIQSFNGLYFSKNTLHSVISKVGDIKTLRILIGIILLIFVISAINLSNLKIILANKTQKTNAISMINGAHKKNIIYQNVIASTILIIVSILIVLCLFPVLLPAFNTITGVSISLTIGKTVLLNGIIMICASIIALIYPIFSTLHLHSIAGMKIFSPSVNLVLGRNSLIVFQYTLTFVLLIASVTVVKQLKTLLSKDLGFHQNDIIRTKLFYDIPYPFLWNELLANLSNQTYLKSKANEWDAQLEKQKQGYQFLKNELESAPVIQTFTQGSFPINHGPGTWKLRDGDADYSTQNGLSVSANYANTFNLTVVEGRFFQTDRDKSHDKKVVINETAKRYWNIQDISKSRLLNSSSTRNKGQGYEIIGVVKDFHYEHLSSKPKPLIMTYRQDRIMEFIIRFREGRVTEGLELVKNLFTEQNPGKPFTYSFLSDEIEDLYSKEKRLSSIYILFTLVALIISTIGLFTIALYDTQRRVKEIGIRKVNGAKENEILIMLNKDFLKWVLLAFAVAAPISYFAMRKWLENFAYKTTLSWWIFALAGALALGIALFTVSWQSWRAATRNPIESLRYE